MPDGKLTPAAFAIVSTLIEEATGIHYRPGDADLLEAKLGARALDAGFESILDYYYYLRYDPGGPAELGRLIDALVVGETYFFREEDQLRALVRELIAPAVRLGARPRIWCAASSTGEEPLTVAMLLEERGVLDAVEIIGTDVSGRALDAARAGRFRARSLRSLPPRALGRWLHPTPDGGATVDPRIAAAVRWDQVNLVNPAEIARLGTFDAVLCRNVLIYFRDETIRRVVRSLSRALAPGGVLLVSVSESLMRHGLDLRCEERGGAFFYRRTDEP